MSRDIIVILKTLNTSQLSTLNPTIDEELFEIFMMWRGSNVMFNLTKESDQETCYCFGIQIAEQNTVGSNYWRIAALFTLIDFPGKCPGSTPVNVKMQTQDKRYWTLFLISGHRTEKAQAKHFTTYCKMLQVISGKKTINLLNK